MTRGTKKFLKNLRYLFKQGSDQTTEEVWNILTALRGPDDTDSGIKTATTEVIRHKVFGQGSKVETHANVSPDFPYKAEGRKKISYNHFGKHAERAFEALGMSWKNYNK